jgi:integrase
VVAKLSATHKKGTVAKYFEKLNAAFRYAASPGVRYLAFNPCDSVIIVKPDDDEEHAVWNDDQSNHFIEFCKSTIIRYAEVFVLLLKTGARIGEILALRWPDIDFDAGAISITRTVAMDGYNPPKSKHGNRKVLLDESTVQMLSRYRDQQGKQRPLHGEDYNSENLVFCFVDGGKLMYRTALLYFNRLVKSSGLPNITPHGLRHTHATMLIKHHHDVISVAKRLGDRPATIEKTYAHALADMEEAMVKTVEQVHGKN